MDDARTHHASTNTVQISGSTTTITGTREQLEAIRESIRRGLAGAPSEIDCHGWNHGQNVAVKVLKDAGRA